MKNLELDNRHSFGTTTESGNYRFKILMAASKKWDTPGFSTRPVVFLIYINIMPDKIASKIYLFADDAKLYGQIEDKLDVTRIHEGLKSLESWSD